LALLGRVMLTGEAPDLPSCEGAAVRKTEVSFGSAEYCPLRDPET
jgi:hypothetical protein